MTLPYPTESSPIGLFHSIKPNDATPSLRPHYRIFSTTTGCSAPVPCIGSSDTRGTTTCVAPLASRRQVLTFRTKAYIRFTPSLCRSPLGQ